MKNILAEKIWTIAEPILQTKKIVLADLNLINVKHFKWRCLPSEYGKASTVHGKFMKWIRDGRIQALFDAMRKEYLLKSDAISSFDGNFSVHKSKISFEKR